MIFCFGALIPLRVAHKEHTSVWVTSRLSPYVCLSVCALRLNGNCPDQISVYLVYTLDVHWQCTLCIHCSGPSVAPVSSAISVPQCILAVYVQYTLDLNTLEFDLGVHDVLLLVC